MNISEQKMLYEKQALIFKALAHPLRIAIVDFLRDGPRCVCEITGHVKSEQSNVSRHLAVMVNAGVLEYRKEGLKVIYRLKCACIVDFFSCVTGVLKQQAKENGELLKAI
jgi:ArsR family transcriptional regulator